MLKIQAQLRDSSVKNDELRANGLVPCVVYGANVESQKISIDSIELKALINKSNDNSKITLSLDGKDHVCLIKEAQLDFMKNRVIHVDFMVLDESRKVQVLVPLKFVGQSLAVKKLAAVPKFFMSEVEVKCLPKDLPEFIEVDMANLVGLDSIIHVSDLKISEGVEMLSDKLHSVATVAMPKRKSE